MPLITPVNNPASAAIRPARATTDCRVAGRTLGSVAPPELPPHKRRRRSPEGNSLDPPLLEPHTADIAAPTAPEGRQRRARPFVGNAVGRTLRHTSIPAGPVSPLWRASARQSYPALGQGRDSAPAALQPLARIVQPLPREVRRLVVRRLVVSRGCCRSGSRRRRIRGGRLLASEQPNVEELVELLA
jgi:hypothetical protein